MNVVFESGFDRVFDTQRIYRLMLDAVARPGKIMLLARPELYPPAEINPYAAGVAFTLLDSETSFALLPDNEASRQYICLNSGSRAEELSRAQFIILDGRGDFPELAGLCRGDLLFPERGATLIVMVDAIGEQGDGLRLTLRGPGVDGIHRLVLKGLCPANMHRVQKLNREFPLGVDLILTDQNGALAALPRSCAVDIEEEVTC
ncbi:phosphonate C-P lyase system protein PhnH [Desulfoscipio gibsoniae]